MKINFFNKHRKILVLGPIIAIGIIILYLLTNKIYSGYHSPATDTLSQLNKTLPKPHLKDDNKTKLEAYMQFQTDSINNLKKMEELPAKQFFNPGPPPAEEIPESSTYSSPYTGRKDHLDLQEKKVNEQLDKIRAELDRTEEENEINNNNPNNLPITSEQTSDIIRLEQLLNNFQTDTTQDPEMRQLDAMLDKILKIQHPGTLNESSFQDTGNFILPVKSRPNPLQKIGQPHIFYGLKQQQASFSTQKTAIQAVVHDDQTVQNGSTIKLRLVETIYLGQQEIPANTFVYGTCNITDERLQISLSKIVHNNTIIPIKLMVYDIDGIVGLHIPGAITRDAAKEGLDRTVQSLTMTSMDPSIAAQATSAGIQSLRSFLSKKVKQIKVTVKAGHRLYIQ